MIAEIALATNTLPSQWLAESDEMISTVLDIYEQRAKDRRKESRKRKG